LLATLMKIDSVRASSSSVAAAGVQMCRGFISLRLVVSLLNGLSLSPPAAVEMIFSGPFL
jgi:hypothetical protein